MPAVALASSDYALHSPVDADREIHLIARELRARGVETDVQDWQDAGVDWARYRLVVLKSPWGYHHHPAEFSRWLDAVSRLSTVLNPPEVIRWNMDKRYLGQLADAGVPVCPSRFADGPDQLRRALAATVVGQVVIKPTVSAASAHTGRFDAGDPAAVRLAEDILAQGKQVVIQPAITSVARVGERSLIYFDGDFVHAVRKGPLLALGGGLLGGDEYEEQITPEQAPTDEREVADAALRVAAGLFPEAGDGRPLLYARVDLARDDDDRPLLMELELFEPSYFLDLAPGAEARFVDAVVARLVP